MDIFTKKRVARRDLGNRTSPVDRAHMKRPLGMSNSGGKGGNGDVIERNDTTQEWHAKITSLGFWVNLRMEKVPLKYSPKCNKSVYYKIWDSDPKVASAWLVSRHRNCKRVTGHEASARGSLYKFLNSRRVDIFVRRTMDKREGWSDLSSARLCTILLSYM